MSATTFIVASNGESGGVVPAAAEIAASSSPVAFLDYIRPDLDAVEARLNAELGADVRTVLSVAHHVLSAGGKRLRPAMVAFAARAVQPDVDRERLATVGASVEFVHMATLVHDDVVDNTATRRGKPTANAVFGNGVAVLSGDYMLARAMRLISIYGDIRIIRTISEITVEMSEGEVMEIMATGKADLTLDEYLEILRKKTAVFVEGCCRCGALLTGADERLESALASYGYRLGMAFQIADDLLDYTGDPLLTGKPRGSDLRDGRATLPFLLGLSRATARERQCLLAAFGNAALDNAGMQEICDLLARYDAFDQTREAARDHVDQAAASLALLPPTIARDCFSALTDFVVQRDR